MTKNNWTITTLNKKSVDVSDFRQKNHIVLIYEPDAAPETVQCWQAAIQADRAQWDWLQAKIFLVKKGPADMTPGVHIIDRYGEPLHHFAAKHWSFADIEKEFIYYEACHC